MNVSVSGTDIKNYKYKLSSTDCSSLGLADYTIPSLISAPISDDISSLSEGPVYLCVIGQHENNNWQDVSSASRATWIKDTTAPTVVISSTSASTNNLTLIPIDIIFSENMASLTSSNLIVSGATVSSFAGSGSAYTASLTPDSDGTITVDIASSTVNDLYGNPNVASAQFTRVSDRTGATPTITPSVSGTTNLDPIPVTISFNEDVQNFDLSDINVVGATKSNFSGSNSSYSFYLSPTVDGLVTIDVAANVS
jgi:hypothetical protein